MRYKGLSDHIWSLLIGVFLYVGIHGLVESTFIMIMLFAPFTIMIIVHTNRSLLSSLRYGRLKLTCMS